MLKLLNPHPKDEFISFREFDDNGNNIHEYRIENIDKKPTSVTTLIHKFFPSFNSDKVIDKMMKSKKWESSKYYNMSKKEIKELWEKNGKDASSQGTQMHEDIERYFNNEPIKNPNSIEFNYFLVFWNEFKKTYPTFNPYRTEWLVYDIDYLISGSIDFVLCDSKNNFILIDWKRSKEIKTENPWENGFSPLSHLENCNYNHYMLQLNIYRHILETQYNKRVIGMFVAVFHPINPHFLIYHMPHYDILSIWPTLCK